MTPPTPEWYEADADDSDRFRPEPIVPDLAKLINEERQDNQP